jgi:Ran GTPase-activating protein (RanGAP) involved in mRNA processing and transport
MAYTSIFQDLIQHINSLLGQLEDEFYRGVRVSKFYDYKQIITSGNYTPETLNQIVNDFVDQLKLDIQASRNHQIVSECAFFAPRRSGAKQYIADLIRTSLFPPKDDTAESIQKTYITYQKTLSTLSNIFKQQEFTKLVLKQQFKISRLAEHRELWEQLKSRPISEQIANPKAMPVHIATSESLEPFFDFLKLNLPINQEVITQYNSLWIPADSCLKFTRGAIYPDGRMDLCKQVVGPTHIGTLMDSMRDNPNIKHFLLGNNIMGTVGCIAVKEFLLNPHEPRIHTWYLAGNDINNIGISHLIDGLVHDTDVRELWLKRNPIRDTGMPHIQRLLETNNYIHTLDLHNTAIFDSGMKYVCDGLKKNTSLRKLYLDANAIGPIGVDYLIDYFKQIISENRIGITSLWLEMNRIGDDAMIKLVNVLKDYKHLERLCIGSNMLTCVSMEAIYYAFKDHNNIKVLDLGMYKSTADMGEITNRIGDIGAQFVGKIILENKSIKYMSILHNDITKNGIKYISECLEQNDNILFLDFKQYFTGIEQDINKKIMDKLIVNRSKVNISEADSGNYLRELKHTPEIVHIDSIYRNNDKATGPICTMKAKNH